MGDGSSCAGFGEAVTQKDLGAEPQRELKELEDETIFIVNFAINFTHCKSAFSKCHFGEDVHNMSKSIGPFSTSMPLHLVAMVNAS